MGDFVQVAGSVLGAKTRVRIPRGIFSKYIPWDGLWHLGLTIRLEGTVAA
jgi:hypothetical protein